MQSEFVAREFSDSELEGLQGAANIVRKHEDCEGTGVMYNGEQFEDCDCRKVFYYLRDLTYSKIPRSYWKILTAGLIYDTVEPFLLDEYARDPAGLYVAYFEHPAKTLFLSIAGKKLLQNRKRVLYMEAGDLVEIQKDNSDASDIMKGRIAAAEVLLLDDYSRLSHEWMREIVLRIIRQKLSNDYGVLLALDEPEKEIDKLLSKTPGGEIGIKTFEPESVKEYMDQDFINEAKESYGGFSE